MFASIPVLEDMNGYFDICIYESTSDGAFHRTAKHPFRVLTGLIEGISASMGTIEMHPHTNASISWKSPTVTSNLEHYPQSVYQFFRDKIHQHQYYIASVNDGVSRVNTLTLHEIHFKPGLNAMTRKLFTDKFIDAMHLWGISKNAYRR